MTEQRVNMEQMETMVMTCLMDKLEKTAMVWTVQLMYMEQMVMGMMAETVTTVSTEQMVTTEQSV